MVTQGDTATAPGVTLTAGQCRQLRFEVSLGLTAAVHFAAWFTESQGTNTSPHRASNVVDVYWFVDHVLARALGAGLIPGDQIAPVMDSVMLAAARVDAESLTTAQLAAAGS